MGSTTLLYLSDTNLNFSFHLIPTYTTHTPSHNQLPYPSCTYLHTDQLGTLTPHVPLYIHPYTPLNSLIPSHTITHAPTTLTYSTYISPNHSSSPTPHILIHTLTHNILAYKQALAHFSLFLVGCYHHHYYFPFIQSSPCWTAEPHTFLFIFILSQVIFFLCLSVPEHGLEM